MASWLKHLVMSVRGRCCDWQYLVLSGPGRCCDWQYLVLSVPGFFWGPVTLNFSISQQLKACKCYVQSVKQYLCGIYIIFLAN